MDFSEPETTLGKTIKAHIEDEDGDASKVEVLTLSKNELIWRKHQSPYNQELALQFWIEALEDRRFSYIFDKVGNSGLN